MLHKSSLYHGRDLRFFERSGATISDAAEDVGVSENSLKSALTRRGIELSKKWEKTVRQMAEDMPATEAVDFLLSLLEEVAPGVCGEQHPVDGWAVHLTPQESRLAKILYDAHPHCVNHDRLASIIDALSEGRANNAYEHVKVIVSRLRKKFKPIGVEIVTHHSMGYSMMLPEPVGGGD